MTGLSGKEGREVCECNSITHTSSDHELSRQSVMKAYHITTSFRAGEGEGKKRRGKELCSSYVQFRSGVSYDHSSDQL